MDEKPELTGTVCYIKLGHLRRYKANDFSKMVVKRII